MADHGNDRSGFLAGLTDAQAELYHQTNHASGNVRTDFWTTLRGMDAPAADKYAVATAMGYGSTVTAEYALELGIDPHGGKVDMTSLGRGAQFTGPDDHTRYEVTTPASEHERGWVEVRDLSMTDEQADNLLARPGAVEEGCDPRDGFFAYSFPTYVQPVADPSTAKAADNADNGAVPQPPEPARQPEDSDEF